MAVPALIGAELSQHVAAMQAILEDFDGARYISRADLAGLRKALDGARRIARQSQQLSRLASGRLRQSHERLALQELVMQVLGDNAASLRLKGANVEPRLVPVEVVADPGLLMSLVESALDWTIALGQGIQLTLDVKNWPEHAMLVFKVRPLVASGRGPSRAEARAQSATLEWLLLEQIARTMGVLVEHRLVDGLSLLSIEFPCTVRRMEGLTAMEVDDGESIHGQSRALAGHRVLLVCNDESLKRDLRQICEAMGLLLDATPTTKQAVRFCELEPPDLVVIDERLRDPVFDQLRHDLLDHNVNFPFVEIAEGRDVVEVASWTGERMSRVSRDSLKNHLPSIVAMELAKVI